MLSILLSALILSFLTVCTHAAGIAVLLGGLRRLQRLPTRFWPTLQLMLRMIWWLVLLHLAEISIWGSFYLWRGCLTDAEAAFYYSGVTYTTIGYGDVVLAKPWRLLAPVEGLIGVLMFGLSTGYFFVVANRIYQSRPGKATPASASEG
jgi:ion channel